MNKVNLQYIRVLEVCQSCEEYNEKTKDCKLFSAILNDFDIEPLEWTLEECIKVDN